MKTNPHVNGEVLHAGASLQQAGLAVLLLHGRGASAEDILGLASAFNLEGVAYFAPQAAGSTWYPLSFLAPREANEPYLSSALEKVDATVRQIEQAGVPRDRIVIAGFSQGACLATEYVATHPAQYGGLIAFTGGLIGPPEWVDRPGQSYTGKELQGVPALLASGDPDPHVPWARVEQSAAVLRSMGASVTMKRYPGRPHTITADEIRLARDLLASVKGSIEAKSIEAGQA